MAMQNPAVLSMNQNQMDGQTPPIDPEELRVQQESENKKIGDLLKSIIDGFEQEDRVVRDTYIRLFKKHDLYWNGKFSIVWDATSREWISIAGALKRVQNNDIDTEDYDKAIGIYRAHGESIIAALAAHVPNQIFFPENADSEIDIESATAYTLLSKKICVDNDADSRYAEILQNFYNFGIAFVYSDFVESPDYGFVERYLYNTEPHEFTRNVCPHCQYEVESPDMGMCPQCGMPGMAETQSYTEDVPVLQDIKKEPNGREVIRIYSPLEVHVPHYIKNAADLPYLILETEVHRSKIISMFSDQLRGKLTVSTGSDNRTYPRRVRLDDDAVTSKVITVRQVWLANWTFEEISDEEDRDLLINKFPNGCYCVFADDIYLDSMDENMHDHWSLPEWPTSRRVFAKPVGAPEIPIQDMIIELTDLTMETIEQGIPQTFADPEVLDFDAYSENRAVPGAVYPLKGRVSNQGADKSFVQLRTATLSQEVKDFRQYLDYQGQFVVADFPSIFGGAMDSGSKTLGEYQGSQQSAMQRLSLIARVGNKLWSSTIRKSVLDLRKKMKTDINYVQRQGNTFINSWIKKEQMSGEVGRVEPETSDLFPLTEAQRRAIFTNLLQTNNQQLLMFFMHPENIGYAVRLLGFENMFIPGDRDRNKQLSEIQELLKGQPIPDEMGNMLPSIPVETLVDDHVAHIQTLRAWLISPNGMMTQKENEMGYQNCIAHLLAHMKDAEVQNQQQQPPNGEEKSEPVDNKQEEMTEGGM